MFNLVGILISSIILVTKGIMSKEEIEIFYARSKKHWRAWLEKNHNKKKSVWLLCYKKSAETPTISWSDSVDEALCFGWIDSIRKSVDHEKFIQFYSRRKPNSAWSKINKEKVARMASEGLISQAGLDAIELAKKNGSWTKLDEVEELTIPVDLAKAFKSHPGSKKYFTALSRSNKRIVLQWIALAKRPETRKKRIDEVAKLAGKNLMPKQFRPIKRV